MAVSSEGMTPSHLNTFELPFPSAVSYVSHRSAEVILSDIRPIQVKAEALQCVNSFLDELLFSVLREADSLNPDKLREGLRKVLPTQLGKEALLEAEVELKAFYERTGPLSSPRTNSGGDGPDFQLVSVFQLLRLKCEAYCTLNDEDEDAEAERRLMQTMAEASGSVAFPKASMVAPAALYLTAVLEAISEHILTNVGRVVARESTRTVATAQELFVALCEDVTIFDTFKRMKVFERIENMVNLPRQRRISKVTVPLTRTESPFRETSPAKDVLVSRSDSPGNVIATPPGSVPAVLPSVPARSSLEKKSKKMFGGRVSGELSRQNSATTHKKADSVHSNATKHTLEESKHSLEWEDEEFENAMRSDKTMKMSLTPDRLKTMESHSRAKADRASNSRPSAKRSFPTDPALPLSPPLSPENTLRQSGPRRIRPEDSIVEDDEEGNMSALSSPSHPPVAIRTRSISSAATPNRILRKRSFTHVLQNNTAPEPPMPIPNVPSALSKKDRPLPKQLDTAAGMPPRTRRVARNRESIDLDDIMNGSDDEPSQEAALIQERHPAPKTAPAGRRPGQPSVSANTRDLMDFLENGPPEDPMQSRVTTEMAQQPKSSGRLQKMMSKLKLSQTNGNAPSKPMLKSQKSMSNLTGSTSSIPYPVPATRPVPPRYPMRPPSPPSSHGSIEESTSSVSGSRSQEPSLRSQSMGTSETTSTAPPVPKLPTGVQSQEFPTQASPHVKQQSIQQTPIDVAQRERVDSLASKPSLTPSEARGISKLQIDASVKRPVPLSPNVIAAKPPTADEANDIRRQLARATSADECRLLMDMFLARAGLGSSSSSSDSAAEMEVPYPSPQSSEHASTRPSLNDRVIETALVEMFLGGNPQSITLREKAASRPSSPRSQGDFEAGGAPTSMLNQPLPPLSISTAAQ